VAETRYQANLLIFSMWIPVGRTLDSEPLLYASPCHMVVRYMHGFRPTHMYAWKGDGQCKSDYIWPLMTELSMGEWRLWQQALQMTLSLDHWQCIKTPLGDWLEEGDPMDGITN